MNTANHRLLRDINLSLVLQMIQEQAPISQRDLVQHTGLSPSTVFTLINQLHASELLRECGYATSSGGRRPKLLEMNPEGGYFISVDLGGTKISIGVLDLVMHLRQQWVYPTPSEGGEGVFQKLMEIISDTCQYCESQAWKILGIGICTSGIVDCLNGIVIEADNFGWHDFPLADRLKASLGFVPVIEHDTNAAAYAEFVYGAARGQSNVVYVSIGTGIGAGLILNGRLFTGSNDMAGEIGHITVHHDGPMCRCGKRGCLEAVASGPAIARAYVQRRGEQVGVDWVDGKTVIALAEQKDAISYEIVTDAGKMIGHTVGNLTNILNLDTIVIGGGVMAAGGVMFSAIKEGIQSVLLPRMRDTPHISKASYGPSAGLVGIGALSLARMFNAVSLSDVGGGHSGAWGSPAWQRQHGCHS
ncbi:ROK family transcriptional regulator [Alicyclobacillus fastidiosus]|uniref:ROK family transcriptional regulator n=1 Tax=Alicyclobacillus fastidiosus TaxID=392011 RepID=A0ABY6ZMB2_9BACL|nr:ROK family transcriptional regulator [Alicyclobacillus fastidiosus]WAH43960.1 ROK family transcriptional regulator [Alicyclobacillus fastidiosus]GMA60215.1 xylose repressor [Alicyclobacillus fastidiosus]